MRVRAHAHTHKHTHTIPPQKPHGKNVEINKLINFENVTISLSTRGRLLTT